MGQFQNDLQLYKSLEPAARPIDTYAPIRLPSAGPQLNELAEGLSVFNRGLKKNVRLARRLLTNSRKQTELKLHARESAMLRKRDSSQRDQAPHD